VIAHPLPRALPDEGSLTVAMAVAPNVYARNRMFAFYKEPAVQRARTRAATIRGAVRQLASERRGATNVTLCRTEDGGAVLRYRIESMKLERTIELTPVEAACIAYLATKAGVPGLAATEEERALLDRSLQRLALGLELPRGAR
jgi:hypothetical protein